MNSTPSWIRSRINIPNGFQSWPWLYVNIKFRPHNGDYRTYTVGGATDYPTMRVEEMYFLKAEAALHTSGVPAAARALEDIVKTRNSEYTCTATTAADFLDEYVFQKGIEFWGTISTQNVWKWGFIVLIKVVTANVISIVSIWTAYMLAGLRAGTRLN